MGWQTKNLGDVIALQRGYDLPEYERKMGDVPVYGSFGITGYHNVARAVGPGVTIGRSGASFGVVSFSEVPFWPHNATLFVTDFKGNDPRFISYLLKNTDFSNLNSGSAQPSLNRNYLYLLTVRVPDSNTQLRIASILSAYDDLIENNTRRIKVLEEMAQLIYGEWFVNFRFPGREKVNLVTTQNVRIPDGWNIFRVEDIVARVPSGKKYEQKTVSPNGQVPVLDQGKTGIIGYHDDLPGVQASFADPIITFANHTCYQRLVLFPFSAIQNVLPFRSTPEHKRDIYWLHWATKDLIRFNDYKGHWPEFINKRVLVPTSEVAAAFGDIVKHMAHACHVLEKANQNLRQTRDLLLPRLISGEISVEQFETQTACQIS